MTDGAHDVQVEIHTRHQLRLVGDALGQVGRPSIIFLHGGGQTRHSWRRAVETVSAHGWYAASFDLPAHGDSAWTADGAYPMQLFVECVSDVSADFDRPVLVGASLGGIAALLAVGEGHITDARGLVLVDITPRIERGGADRIQQFMRSGADGFPNLESAADVVSEYLTDRPRPPDISGLRKNLRQRADGRWYWHWDPRFIERGGGRVDVRDRMREAARALDVPALLIRGTHSDVVSDEGVAELVELIPHLLVADVTGAGHMVAGSRNDVFNHAILEFLATL